MLLIEGIYFYQLIHKTSWKDKRIKKEDFRGIVIGIIFYIPFIIAFVSSAFIHFCSSEYKIFSDLSIAIVIILVFLMHRHYNKKIKAASDDKIRIEYLKDRYHSLKYIAKSFYFVNSLIIGLVLIILGTVLKLPPTGFFKINSSELGKEVLSGVLPILGFAAIDYFDFTKNLKDFLKDLWSSLKDYYGFYFITPLFTAGFIFFLKSNEYENLFRGGVLGAAIPLVISMIYIIFLTFKNKNDKLN